MVHINNWFEKQFEIFSLLYSSFIAQKHTKYEVHFYTLFYISYVNDSKIIIYALIFKTQG